MDDPAPVGDHGIDGRVTERLEMLAETLPGVALPAVKRQHHASLYHLMQEVWYPQLVETARGLAHVRGEQVLL